MDRRTFAVALGSAALGPAALGAAGGGRVAREAREPAAGATRGQSRPRHWAWVHGNTRRAPAEWRRRFARLRAAGFHGVHVGGGDAAVLSAAVRGEGLVFSRWTWTLNRSGDERVKREHPEWFTVSREGKSSLSDPPYVPYYQWLCPTRPEVRAYLAAWYAEVAHDPAVDEVHLDYVRHGDVILPVALWPRYNIVQHTELPPYDFCYCAVCRDAFQRLTGRDPLRLADPPGDPEWRRFRWDSVTGLVRDVVAVVRSAGKPVTAAVFPTPAIARRLVRQAWDEWPLDGFYPMLYNGFYNEPVSWIADGVRAGRTALTASRPLVAGLYLPDLPPAALGEAARGALTAGAEGLSLFEMDGATDAHLREVAALRR
jgi:hypothetical protein